MTINYVAEIVTLNDMIQTIGMPQMERAAAIAARQAARKKARDTQDVEDLFRGMGMKV